ncbi:hypothetical protein AQUCO_00900961v1 [Aquilegia coerulea]|uniref:F-box domain-containing protein n=1 Tax=Aquilegia coerulea TaxID=218851 RepID=A0A2G5EG76_AQUCA|nr:hypothetical protein AQUCO_00900961v1 [Aquilegia coerulea]
MRRSIRLLVKKITWNVSFPEEILIEIFSRLPVKLLLQCKCLSKNWYKLISSPHFVRLHHHHLNANQYNERILFASSSNHQSVILHSLDHKTDNDTTAEYKSLCLPTNKIIVAGSCNGLVWFGCDPLTNTYKAVRIDVYSSTVNLGYCEAYVYTLGTKEWRRLTRVSRLLNINTVPHVNGALHWFKLTDYSKWTDTPRWINSVSIVSFNVGREEFLEVPWISLPKVYHNTLGLLQGCLASYAFDYYGDGSTDIWLMKDYGVKESWTKILSIPTQVERKIIEPIIIGEKGEILFARKFWLSRNKGHLYAYDPMSNSANEYAKDIIAWFDVYTYVESLVQIPSYSGEDETKKQGNTGVRRKRKAKAH